MTKILNIMAIILTCNSIYSVLQYGLNKKQFDNILINHGLISIYYLLT